MLKGGHDNRRQQRDSRAIAPPTCKDGKMLVPRTPRVQQLRHRNKDDSRREQHRSDRTMLGRSADDEHTSGGTTNMAKKATKWTNGPPATDGDRE